MQLQRVEVCPNGVHEPVEHILTWGAEKGIPGLIDNLITLHKALHSAPSKEKMAEIADEAAAGILAIDPDPKRFGALLVVARRPILQYTADTSKTAALCTSRILEVHEKMCARQNFSDRMDLARDLLGELLLVGGALYEKDRARTHH